LIDEPAVPFFQWPQLKVFDELPADRINIQIHESFVPKAPQPSVPRSANEWARQRKAWMKALREKSFRGWPRQTQAGPLDVKRIFSVKREGVRFSAFDFTSQPHVRLRLYLAHQAGLDKPETVVLNVLNEQGWTEWLAAMRVGFADELSDSATSGLGEPDEDAFERKQEMFRNNNCVMAYLAPRGIGLTAWNTDERKRTQIRRRFMLLGQTLDGMRVWDVRRAIQALRTLDSTREVPMALQGNDQMAGIALYASLFEPGIARLDLWHLPDSHRDGPVFLNVLRYQIRLYQEDDSGWRFPQAVAEKLGWPGDRFQMQGK
jgi:hypothetical protein